MLGIAIRISQALSLHIPEPPFATRPFEQEMRRRLWLNLGVLDTLVSLDRVSEPLLQASWLSANPPTNANDTDISFDMDAPGQQTEGFTDLTFPLIVNCCVCALRTLNFADFIVPGLKSMQARQQVALEFQQSATDLLRGCQPDRVVWHWFVKQTTESMIATVHLITLRPLQRASSFNPPRVRGDTILKLAVDILRKINEFENDPQIHTWSLLDLSFPTWHSIAVATAELCVCDDPAIMERYWPFVEESYNRFGGRPDSLRAVVWKTVEKFMAQGRVQRDRLLSTAPVQHPTQMQPQPQQQTQIQTPLISHAEPLPSTAFTPLMNQQNQTVYQAAMPFPTASTMPTGIPGPSSANNMIGPWPNVWDGMEYPNPNAGMDGAGAGAHAWNNYEGFIEDLYDNMEAKWAPH